MKKREYWNIFMGVISTAAILLNYVVVYKQGLEARLIVVSPLVSLIVLVAMISFYFKFNKVDNKNNRLQGVVAFFLALVMIFGKSYDSIQSWDLVFGNGLMLLLSCIGIIGYFSLFLVFFKFLNFYVGRKNIEGIVKKNSRLVTSFDEKTFICSFICLVAAWLIYLIAYYPGMATPDATCQILQTFNVHTSFSDSVIKLDPNSEMTNHHPLLHTILLGTEFRAGKAILNDNFGIFICTLTQFLLLALTLSYTIAYMKKINISINVRLGVLLLYCLVPAFPYYSVSIVKDTVYACFVILYIIQLYDYVKFYKEEKLPVHKTIYLFIIMMLITLFRNNGIYLVALSFVFALSYSKTNRGRMSIVFIMFIVIYKMYMSILLPLWKIPKTSVREMLSIPFQQTARYIKYYEDDYSSKEKKIINKILPYNKLGKLYNPEVSDPVKGEFNKYATKDDLKQYFKVWLKGLKRHPGCYVEAFLNQTYGYLYPSNKRWYVYTKGSNLLSQDGGFDYHFLEASGNIRNILKEYASEYRTIPAMGMVCNIGFNTIAVIVMFTYLIVDKEKRKYCIILLPHVISILICIASPVNNHFRYAMPYIFAMPVTIIFFMKETYQNKEENNGEE